MNPAFVLYNGQAFGDAVGGGSTMGVGKMLPDPLVIHANAAMNMSKAPWAREGTNAMLTFLNLPWARNILIESCTNGKLKIAMR